MRIYDIIVKKRNGGKLDKSEIEFFINEYTKGTIADYQASALLMAMFIKGLSKKETVDLTMAMVNSGTTLDLSAIKGIKVDKHSTGGVGDKTTLVLAPLVASAGVPVAKMSGRGLGHTGGTLDKLESIDGFNVQLEMDQFIKNVNEIKIAICGQTADLAPADKKLYSLRDVTGTVDNISLIASSVMSKKIASGADGIVLDVKTGSGAFMKTIDDSFELAKEMVDIGSSLNRNVVAFVTEMNEPLGYAVGNALELKEAIETLKGNGPADLTELCLDLGAEMLIIGKKAETVEEAKGILRKNIENGSALKKLAEMVTAQQGNSEQIYNTDLLPQAQFIVEIKSEYEGFVTGIDAEEIGMAALLLGAGRTTKESAIDYSAGVVLKKKVCDHVMKGDVIAELHTNELGRTLVSNKRIMSAYSFATETVEKRPLIFGKVTKDAIEKY